MKNIDIKSLIIGALFTSTVLLAGCQSPIEGDYASEKKRIMNAFKKGEINEVQRDHQLESAEREMILRKREEITRGILQRRRY